MKKSTYALALASCLVLSSGNLLAGEGSGSSGRGGGFMNFNGQKILKAALAELPPYLARVQPAMFLDFPERKLIVEQALKTIEVRPNEVRRRDGQKLVMDYNQSRMTVVILRPFFEGFQTSALTSQTVYSAEQLILHEIAHLWGADDIEADQFATDTLSGVSLTGQELIIERTLPFDLEECIANFRYSIREPWSGSCRVYGGGVGSSHHLMYGTHIELNPEFSEAEEDAHDSSCLEDSRGWTPILHPRPWPGRRLTPTVSLSATSFGYQIDVRNIPDCRGPDALRRAFAGHPILEVKATFQTNR